MLRNDRKKVLHVLAGGGIGGAQRFMEWFMRSASQKNFTHEVVFLYHGGVVQLNLEKMGFVTPILNWKNGYSISGRWRLLRFIASCDPDIIQFHDATPLVRMIVKCFFPSKPLLQFCHGFGRKPWLVELGQVIDDKFTDLVICNSDFTARAYAKTFRRNQRMKRVYLGLNLDQYRESIWANPITRPPISEKDFIEIIYLGRLQDIKGVLDLPALAVELQKLVGSKFCIHVVGDGPAYNQLQDFAKSLHVEEKIILWGGQENVLPFLMRADILVFPSWCEEAFGLALLEAVACGLPVVAYDSGAVPEVIGKAPGAVIVEKKNVKELAAAIARTVSTGQYPNISECIAYLDGNFNIDRTVLEMEQIYEEILAGPGWFSKLQSTA